MTIGLLYLAGGILALCLIIWAFWYYGRSRQEIGAQRERQRAQEAYEKNNNALIRDLLDDAHPYSVSGSSIAEIESPGTASEIGLATDLQREGGESGH